MRAQSRRSSPTQWYPFRFGILIGYLSLTAIPKLVMAQDATADRTNDGATSASDPRAVAKEHFLQGLALAKTGNWDRALAEFSESVRLFPTRAALSNVALSLSNLGRNVEALATYGEVLRRFGAAADAADLAALQASRAEVAARVGEISIESEPNGATVALDGRPLGVTPLAPTAVEAGAHVLKVSKTGHAVFERTLNVAPRQLLSVHAALEPPVAPARSVAKATAKQPASPSALRLRSHAYFQVLGGLAWATSLGGDAAASCGNSTPDPTDPTGRSTSACRDRSRPFGALAGARAGYALTEQLGAELFLGYLSMSESLRRRVALQANTDASVLVATDYEDSTRISGPATAVSLSLAMLRTFPLVARAWLGVTSADVHSTNFASYSEPGSDAPTHKVSVPESNQRVWIPFVGPEVQVGYSVSSKLQLGVSLLALVAFAPATPRTGTTPTSSEGRRYFGVAGLGLFDLPREDAIGAFVMFVPNVWIQLGI
jgi:tetratricopeptide (TPR) repeat protein